MNKRGIKHVLWGFALVFVIGLFLDNAFASVGINVDLPKTDISGNSY